MIRNFNSLFVGVIGGLVVAVISSQLAPGIVAYIIYVAVFLFLFINLIGYFRNRMKISIIKQRFGDLPQSIIFEALNLGEKPNSLGKRIILKCLLPTIKSQGFLNGKRFHCIFYLQDDDRLLEPHRPKVFTATTNSDNSALLFSWFRKYEFRPSRGMYSVVYVRNALDNGISYWRYKLERFLLRLFRKTKQIDSITNE